MLEKKNKNQFLSLSAKILTDKLSYTSFWFSLKYNLQVLLISMLPDLFPSGYSG